MSRIDEALRRAAGQVASEEAAVPETPGPLIGAGIQELAEEPFPIEITERRRMRGHTAQPGPGPAGTPPPRQKPFDTEATEPESKSKSKSDSEPESQADDRSRLFERIDAKLAEKVVADQNMSPISREQYRRLAAVLHDAQTSNGLKVMMIASALPGEGKTLTASNLALTLSESYRQRVLLIDADLRRPTLHQVFQLHAASGLIEGLEGGRDTKLVLRQVSPTLSILPAGRPTSDPMAGLTSERMRQLLREARDSFDWVIIDTPPLLLLPDAHLLTTMVDGAVLIVRANSTPHDQVKRAADIIGRQRITGVVLNQAETTSQAGYGSHYYHGYYLNDKPSAGKS